MDSRINHTLIQEKWIKKRENSFSSVPDDRKPFTILNPPPNVTGKLHMGHFLNGTLNDIIARRKRQEGYNVCFRGGTDHAGLATQMKVENYLREAGIDKDSLTEEQFLEECDKWKNKYSVRHH
jgi:valyl-tRNA synthetase